MGTWSGTPPEAPACANCNASASQRAVRAAKACPSAARAAAPRRPARRRAETASSSNRPASAAASAAWVASRPRAVASAVAPARAASRAVLSLFRASSRKAAAIEGGHGWERSLVKRRGRKARTLASRLHRGLYMCERGRGRGARWMRTLTRLTHPQGRHLAPVFLFFCFFVPGRGQRWSVCLDVGSGRDLQAGQPGAAPDAGPPPAT